MICQEMFQLSNSLIRMLMIIINNHWEQLTFQIINKKNGLSFQIAKENQKKFHLLMIQLKMQAKLLAKLDQLLKKKPESITHGSMAMDQNSVKIIMNYPLTITGLIKIL